MKSIRISTLVAIMATVVAFSSCKKNTQDEEDWQSSADQATAQSLYQDADRAADEQAADNTAIFGRGENPNDNTNGITACAAVTIDSSSATNGTQTTYAGRAFPRKVTMDYGTGTVCNGRTISGKTILSLSAPHRSVGSVITQTFDNFKINLHKIEGTRTRTNNTVTGGAPTFTLTMTNGKVTDPDGKTFTWNATHTRTWVAGFETNTASDNIVDITGTATGVNRNGKAFTATVLNAVRMSYACRYPLQGTVKVTRTGLNDRTIDFGTGACDGTATVTVNGTTHTVNLPGR